MLLEQIIANNPSLQPYEYVNTEIAEDGHRLVLYLASRKDTAEERCPYCKGHVHILSSCSMRLRDMPVYTGTRQDLEISYHRYRCQSCARTFCEEIPFRYPETRISGRAASWISSFLRFNIPISTVQKITGVHWDTIKRIQKQIMDETVAERRRKLLGEGYKPKHLAVDEFAIHKGHSYATCVLDLESGEVLWVGKGRAKADFARFFEEIDSELLSCVEAVAMDMNASYNLLVREHLPDALVTEDTKTFRIVIHRNTKRIVITGHGVRTNTVLIEVVRQKRCDLRLTYAGTTANGQNELILVLLLSLLCHHRNQSL